jgi:hypothetical protein
MHGYWNRRYLVAATSAAHAASPEARSAYSDLAGHYKAMCALFERGASRPTSQSA